jgi:hypothetical protein
VALTGLAVALSVPAVATWHGDDGSAVATRDPWLRPFASTSIWNMPIGSGASYADAGLPRAGASGLDKVLLRKLSAADPVRSLIRPGSWTNRCSGTAGYGVGLHLPDSWIVPDATQRPDGGWTTPNHVSAFLQPDGRTLVNTNAVARCSAGGPIFGWQTGKPEIDRTDLYGDGRFGSHGASRLSGIGGAIRPGELSGDAPIQHALDVLVWARYLSYSNGGYRWPAAAADSYAASRYTGTNPEMRMGALLAIAPHVTAAQLGITTHVGRKLFTAMQDYGGYVTDDSAWDANYLSVDAAAVGTFPWGAAEQEDFRRIIDAASVVTNNAPSTIGGGGTPRRPLLPELVPPGAVPPTTVPPTTAPATTAPATTVPATVPPPTTTTAPTPPSTVPPTVPPTTTTTAPTPPSTVAPYGRGKPKRPTLRTIVRSTVGRSLPRAGRG